MPRPCPLRFAIPAELSKTPDALCLKTLMQHLKTENRPSGSLSDIRLDITHVSLVGQTLQNPNKPANARDSIIQSTGFFNGAADVFHVPHLAIEGLQSSASPILNHWRRWIIQRHLSFSPTLITHSHHAKKYLIDHLEVSTDQVVVVPWGADAPDKASVSDDDRNRVRQELGLGQDDFVLLIELNEWNHSWLPKALELLVALKGLGSPNIKFIIAESADHERFQKRAIKSGVSKQLVFCEPRTNQTSLYSACDVYLDPGPDGAFGIGALKAMSLGKPSLANKSLGIAERFIAQKPEFVFDPDQPLADLVEVILVLQKSKDRFEDASAFGQELAHQLSWQESARLHAEVYEKIIAKKRA